MLGPAGRGGGRTFRTRLCWPGRLMMQWVCSHFLQHSPGASTSSKPCRTPVGWGGKRQGHVG